MPTVAMAKPPANFSASRKRAGGRSVHAAERSRALPALAVVVLLVGGGWGAKWLLAERAPQRISIEGNATLDGKPISKAFVQFVPVAPTTGRKLGTEVTGGAFALRDEDGLPVGTYRVEFRTFIDEHAQPHGSTGALNPVSRGPTIPQLYSEKSPFEVSITPDTTKLEFALHSK